MNRHDIHRQSKNELIFDFIQSNPIATIILSGDELLTTQIPVLPEGNPDDFVLYSHIAKHNPQFKYLENNKRALIIFQELDPFISALTKEQGNSELEFSAIHINGQIKLQTDEELKSSLEKTFIRLRKFYGKKPGHVKDMDNIIERQMQLIKGFWCKPGLISTISKLYQNE